jgi:uncharacterized protein (TIGR02996 family)
VTDDEAFIRAIVAAPGDDAPRLVYADWLEERGDPRGAYLHAEIRWTRDRADDSGASLRTSAAWLDPVWVARVSGPPLGVCCDRAVFVSDDPLPTAAQVDQVEKQSGVRFPAQYRAFLLNYNGGMPWPQRFPLPDGRTGGLFRCYSIGAARTRQDRAWDLSFRLAEVAELRAGRDGSLWNDPRGRHLLPIAEGVPIADWRILCLGPDREAPGRVYWADDYLDMGEDSVLLVGESFAAFLANLVDTRPDWVRLIGADDLPGLRRWLDAGGTPNEQYQEEQRHEPVTPLIQAVYDDRPNMVRELIRRGADVPRNLAEVLGTSLTREMAKLIAAEQRRR